MARRLLPLTVSVAVAAVPLALGAPAAADPSNGAVPVTLVCDNGERYDAVFRAGANWNPSLDTGSNAVLIPTSQEFHGTLLDPAGNVVAEFHAEPDERGNSAGRQPNESLCSFDFRITFEDGFSVHGFGTSTIFITPGA